MTFNVEVVLKGRDHAVIRECLIPHGAPATWDDGAVRDMLVETLRAIDRADNPNAPADRAVALHSFSWIVEPSGDQVVIAIEIPMGAAIAGPFTIAQSDLDERISRVLRAEPRPSSAPTVH